LLVSSWCGLTRGKWRGDESIGEMETARDGNAQTTTD